MNPHFLIHVSFVQNTMIYRNIKFNLPSLDRMKQIYISKFMYLMFNIISENIDVIWQMCGYLRDISIDFNLYIYMEKIYCSQHMLFRQSCMKSNYTYNCITPPIQPTLGLYKLYLWCEHKVFFLHGLEVICHLEWDVVCLSWKWKFCKLATCRHIWMNILNIFAMYNLR